MKSGHEFFFLALEREEAFTNKMKRPRIIAVENVSRADPYAHVFLTSWFLRLVSAFLEPNVWVNVVLVNHYTVDIGNPFLWITRCWEWTEHTTFKEKMQPYIYSLRYSVQKDVPLSNPIPFPLTIRSLTLHAGDSHELYLVSCSLLHLPHLIKVIITTDWKSGWSNEFDCSLLTLPANVRTLHVHGKRMISSLPYPLLRSCYLQYSTSAIEQSSLPNLRKLKFGLLNYIYTFPSQLVILSLRVVDCPLSTSIFPRSLKVLRIHQCDSLVDMDETTRLPLNLEVLTLCECNSVVDVWLPDSITYLKLTVHHLILRKLPQSLRVLKLQSLSDVPSSISYPPSLEMFLVITGWFSFDPNRIPDSVKRIVITECYNGEWELSPHLKWGKRLFHKHDIVYNGQCMCPKWIPFLESVATKQYKKVL